MVFKQAVGWVGWLWHGELKVELIQGWVNAWVKWVGDDVVREGASGVSGSPSRGQMGGWWMMRQWGWGWFTM